MKNSALIRLGIVGCGDITESRHLPALRRVNGTKVTALSDINQARLERVAGQVSAARRYTDYRQLVESGEVDAVAVCVPPQLHAEVAIAALAARKHVFIEKPLALSREECDILQACAARHTALKVMVGFNLRWHRLVRAARETIRSNELGEIKLVRTVFTSGVRLRGDLAEWRRRQQSGGGALFELGVHHFDLLRFLFEREMEEVFASSLSGDETAIVAAQLQGGTQVVSAFAEGTGENHEIEIYGERGWLRVSCYRADGFEQFGSAEYPGAIRSRWRGLTRTLLDVPRIFKQSRRGGDYLASYEDEWRHFISAIAHDSSVECTLADGRHALDIALAALEASTTKRAVKVGQAAGTFGAVNEGRLREVASSGIA